MTKKCLRRMAIAAAMVLGISNAHAAPVTWTLQNVVFNDGATASGSFAYDATTQLYSAINVSTTATGGIPATVFLYKSIFGAPGSNAVFLDSNAADLSGSHDLTLFFSTNLTNAGGTIPLQPAQRGFITTCDNSFCGTVVPPSSDITSGSVTTNPTAVPEPVTASMILLGLLGTVVARRRRTTG